MRRLIPLLLLVLAGCEKPPVIAYAMPDKMDDVVIAAVYPLPNGDAYAVGQTGGTWLIHGTMCVKVRERTAFPPK